MFIALTELRSNSRDNERPAWLDNAHHDLDNAVADAYGWKPDMSDDEMLTQLLTLNLERARAER